MKPVKDRAYDQVWRQTFDHARVQFRDQVLNQTWRQAWHQVRVEVQLRVRNQVPDLVLDRVL